MIEPTVSKTHASIAQAFSGTKFTNRETIKNIFKITAFKRILVFTSSSAVIGIMPTIIMPAFGGRYFSNDCSNNNDDTCDYDYTTYNLYNSIFTSSRGFLGFIFAGFIGSLSDSFGRKAFLAMATSLKLITYILMSINPMIWIYWTFSTVIIGIFGNIQVLSALETAYIDDITTPNQKTIGFTIVTAFMSCSLLIGNGITAAITILLDIKNVFRVMAILYFMLLAYEFFWLPESLKNKVKFSYKLKRNWNVFKPLCYITSNPVILWICIINVLISIAPISMSVILVYLNDQMNINNDDISVEVNIIVFATMSISALICAGLIAPFLKSKCKIKDINLAIIGSVMLIASPCVFSIISFIVDSESNNNDVFIYCVVIIVIASILLGGLAFVFPALSAIVSKYIHPKQRGIAFGIVRSYQSITTIFGPFSMGYGYNVSKDIDFPSLIFYVMAGLLFIGFIIMIGPLRRIVEKLEETGEQYSFPISSEDTFLMNKVTLNDSIYSDDDKVIECTKTINSYDAM
eukprot:261085_1